MACFRPVPAWRTASGDVVLVERGDITTSLSLPCGRCDGCLLERARQWSVRLMHESQMHEQCCFVTLTFAPEFLPDVTVNWYRLYFQRFMKRLRKWSAPDKVRFFCAAEYGGDRGRPHFHAALFGVDFRDDRYKWRSTSSGYVVWRSPALERLWSFGSSEIGSLTVESAGYVARYALKKVNGSRARDHYAVVDKSTGEVEWMMPECVHMSLKPGIGAGWFKKFGGDVYPHDRVIVRGVRAKPPRYYDKLLKKVDPVLLEDLQSARVVAARERYSDNTDERLKVRETVLKARTRALKRELT